MGRQNKGGQKLKNHQMHKDWFPNTKKHSLYVIMLLLEFKDNL